MIIYKTTNLINGKWYIGQDSKNNPVYYGSGKLLKKAIKKYGKQNFTKEILEILPLNAGKDALNKAEIYWIEISNAVKSEMSYNVALGGTDVSQNPEVRHKISRKLMGNKNGVGPRPNASGEFWKGQKGSNHHLYGTLSPQKGIKRTKEQVLKNSISHGSKPFMMFDKNGLKIAEYVIVSECARDHNMDASGICRVLKGKRNTYRGFKFSYKDSSWQLQP